MEKKFFTLLYTLFFALHFSFANESISQDSLTTWQEQLDYLKNRTDLGRLRLINYTYKGVIKSESDKSKVIDSLFCDNSPTLLHLPSVIEKDTIVLDNNSYEIMEKQIPNFEIITIRTVIEVAKSNGEENPVIKAKQGLETFIKLGFEILELEWSYKGNTYHSICIVSNENGGVVYEPIGSNILTGVRTTRVIEESH